MKILIGAANRSDSYLFFDRLVNSLKKKNIKDLEIKIAGYKHQYPFAAINWNLSSILNFSKETDSIYFNNDNYISYALDVKRFKPDLVISDLDPYTSNVAIELGIKLWQVSPYAIYYAIDKGLKEKLNIFKNYSTLIRRSQRKRDFNIYAIYNSDRNYVLSILGDTNYNDIIDNKFSWIRPYFEMPENNLNIKDYLVCSHINNIQLNRFAKDNNAIQYSNDREFKSYKFNNYKEDLGKCKSIVNDGNISIIADGFYNEKKLLIIPSTNNIANVMNGRLLNHYSIANLYEDKAYKTADISINDKIKFLHQEIEELC